MLQPKFLKKGATIGILSTARKISLEEIQPAIGLLKSWKLNVVIGKTIGASEHQFAGGDTLRIQDFQKMLDSSNIDAIWCAKGGYGTIRIIDHLDFGYFLKKPKWIIGYSDITVLHSHLHQLNTKSIHAIMPINVPKSAKNSLNSLKNTMFGRITPQITTFSKFNKLGNTKGILVGGNLSILYSLLGSESSIETKGKILFIEDFNEYAYHIDCMMLALKRNGKLGHLNGLIIGSMAQIHDSSIPFGKTIEEIILDAVKEFKYPVCFDFPSGHIDENLALILGSEVALEVTNKETTLTTTQWQSTTN